MEPRRLLATAAPGQVELISATPAGTVAGNAGTYTIPAVSDDGRYVAFTSYATDLAAGPSMPDLGDGLLLTYVRDRVTGTTRLASVGTDGLPRNTSSDPSISGDGRYVTFATDDANANPAPSDTIVDL
jgi:Tol biopolymer transport system component